MSSLEERVRNLLGELDQPGIVEKRMFGGVGYLVHGNMACGVNKGSLIVRVGPDAYERALARPHVKVFDMTGRPMSGWVMVAPEGCSTDEVLRKWVEEGITFALTLPAK
jgi:TfoX/Sxy family transcriptional regulator of competence genes